MAKTSVVLLSVGTVRRTGRSFYEAAVFQDKVPSSSCNFDAIFIGRFFEARRPMLGSVGRCCPDVACNTFVGAAYVLTVLC